MRNVSRFPELSGLPDTIDVQETYWGMILREDDPAREAGLFVNRILRFLAVGLALLAVAQWLLPGSQASADLVPLKLVATALCLSLAMLLSHAAETPLVPEVQFDIKRREIRFAVRKGREASETMAGFAMDHVTGITVDPIVPGSEYAEMRLTLDGVEEPMFLVSGRRAELDPVATRMRRDLLRPMQRVERRMSKAA